MTGGLFGTGLGALLGDISESINTIINLLMDAGHMASRGGGFIGSEFRIKGGSQQFQPGEWKLTQSMGAEIRNSIVPMTFPGPDATLFQLLGLLIEAGKEVASVKDIMTGDTGTKNMTATTTLALIEQGMMVFTAAYKRIFRALKREYKIMAKLNAKHVTPEAYMAFHDLQGSEMEPQEGMSPNAPPIQVIASPQDDYDMSNMDIEPVADPASVTKMQEAAKAQIIMQMAEAGMLDKGAATERALSAAGISNTEELVAKPDPMQAKMGEMKMAAAEAELRLQMIKVDEAMADIEKTRSETMKNVSDIQAQQEGVRLDKMKAQLEALRDGLGQLLGGGFGGMAGPPGYAASQGGFGQNAGASAPGGNGGLLGGQGMAGGGQVVPITTAGPMGGPV
jgi:chaperonin GroES